MAILSAHPHPPDTLLSVWLEALRDVDKKVRAPNIKHRSIPDKRKNVFAGLVITNLFS